MLKVDFMEMQMAKLSKKPNILSPYTCLLLQIKRKISSETQGAKNQNSSEKTEIEAWHETPSHPPKRAKDAPMAPKFSQLTSVKCCSAR